MSLGKDLASIRKSKNLTLEDIQNAVKIPLHTLKSIENESIFSDPSVNKTYVRSFVRSYAKVLKIDDDDVVQALDEMEAGTYSGSLFREPDEDTVEPDSTSETEGVYSDEDKPKTKKKPESPVQDTKPIQTPSSDDVDTINWADMGRKFTPTSKSSKAWVFVVLFIVLGLLGGAGYYFWEDITGFFDYNQISLGQSPQESDTEALPPAPLDSLDVTEELASDAQTQNETPRQTTPIELGDTITVAVYAAYGQLEPIRITSDLNWRTNPFWMEQGEAYNFDFRDTLLIRGQYSRLLLLFNGHIIENPRQNYFNPAFNSIMITRSILDQPRYLAPPPEEFPLVVGEPDSIVYRIRF